MNQDIDEPVRTSQDIQRIINDISLVNTSLDFKWRFVFEGICKINEPEEFPDRTFIGWFIQVEFERPDTSTGEMGIGRSRKEFVPDGTFESGVVKTCWLLIELTVRHELMEGFRWRNKRIFNPHNSVFDLASIQK